MIENNVVYWRQLDILNPETRPLRATIIGVGSLGSYIALTLAKMGAKKLVLYDDDAVEIHNLPIQFFRGKDIGKKKVDAVRDICEEYTPNGIEIESHAEKYSSQRIDTAIVVSALDSHTARREIIKSLVEQAPALYIDVRMGGMVGVVYFVSPSSVPDDYIQSLVGEGEELPCTARGIVFNALFAGAVVTSQIRNWLIGESYPYKTVFATNDLTVLKRGNI